MKITAVDGTSADEGAAKADRPALPGDRALFTRLVRHLREKNRFVLTEELNQFVGDIVAYAKRYRSLRLPAESPFYRARINEFLPDEEEAPLSPDDMGPPPRMRARGGRLNPEGIPYLYLSSDPKTAVAETRPWLTAKLTVARVISTRSITIIDGTAEEVKRRAEDDVDGDLTWKELISLAFSFPYHTDDALAYIPTQYLTEVFKDAGFDGIRYQSAMNPEGWNLVVFDAGAARIPTTELYSVERIDYKIQQEKGR